MQSEELLTLEVTEDDGSITEYMVLATFSAGNREYISLTTTKDPDTIELYRFSGDLEGKFSLDVITSDMELSEVRAAFNEITNTIKDTIDTIVNDVNLDISAEDLPVVTLKDDTGKEYHCDIIKTFDYKGRSYIALMPQNQDTENPTVELFEYSLDDMSGDADAHGAMLKMIPQEIFNDIMEQFLILTDTEDF